MLKQMAPAKVNLVLEVLGKRADGYHEIRSLVQTISLCDVISFEHAEVISLECTELSLLTFENLVLQAAELLKKSSGYYKGVKIKLEKKIPWSAGFGGGSSDAAATLLALNKLWGLGLSTSDLIKLAAQLGSDVPFFIYVGAALIEGRGEKVTPLAAPLPGWFVLLVPPLPRMPEKTQQLYSRLGANNYTDGKLVDKVVKNWSQDERIAPSLLFNVFENVAFDAFPGLENYWKRFEEVGAQNIHLVGSGPALFAPLESESGAKEIQRRLHQQKLEAYVVSTIASTKT